MNNASEGLIYNSDDNDIPQPNQYKYTPYIIEG